MADIKHAPIIDTNDMVRELYFVNPPEKKITPRSGLIEVSAVEIKQSENNTSKYDNAAFVPDDCAAFKFDATFEKQTAGRYYIVWKLKLQPGFLAPWGFHIQANISYGEEPAENSGGLNIVVTESRVNKLEVDKWQDIIVHEQLVVQPHHGFASVKLLLRNNVNPNKGSEGDDGKITYRNFNVGSVAIHPYTKLKPDLRNLDPTIDDPFVLLSIESTSNIPISRISASTEVDHIAILRATKDEIHLEVWDFSGVLESSQESRYHPLNREPAAEARRYPKKGFHELSLGMALSPDGRQLAVFQEPMIGDWKGGSTAGKATFEFQLFHVSILINKSGKSKETTYNIDDMESGLTSSTAIYNIPSLRSFVGFAKFLPASEVLSNNDSPKTEGASKIKNTPLLFATCNGVYLDIYDCTREDWSHLHSITLVDLLPALSRRIICQMMMESMGPNTFLWLEAQGQTCSTWSINNGANISHLSSEDNISFTERVYRSSLKMAISPDESIVALAGIDGSIRTFFANSGIEISASWFTNFKIEYLGFLGQNDQILVILRDSFTHKLQSRIIDPLDPKIRIRFNPLPIPTAGTTLLRISHNSTTESNRKAMVCAAEGTILRFYRVQEIPAILSFKPTGPSVDETLTRITANIDLNGREEGDPEFGGDEELDYRLHVNLEMAPLENGFYWILRVAIIQLPKSRDYDDSILFHFVPEPWLRCLTSDYTMPEKLLTTYFLPCRKRFIIIGFQSIQIWGLPSKNQPRLKLLAFWSIPNDEVHPPRKGKKSNHSVYEYFQKIESAKVYKMTSDLTCLQVKLIDSSGVEDVVLPGEQHSTIHYRALPCYRSIQLMAAAYSFACENEAFEPHATALINFSIQHINRVMKMEDTFGTKGIDPKDNNLFNILSLLLCNPDFNHTSNPFIKALLSSGRSWIPREQSCLNPIQQAIAMKNHEIVHTLVDYCISNARNHHPAYLMPAIQSLDDLREHYPELTEKMFFEASYIKVKNKSYVADNAIIANPHYKFWKFKSSSMGDYDRPVFCLRSQLPFRLNVAESSIKVFYTNTPDNSIKYFPKSTEEKSRDSDHGELPQTPKQESEYIHDIYVAPFPKLSTYSKAGTRMTSKFTNIAGTSLLGNPAMQATLRFKWYKFGKTRWAARFSVVLAFSLLFMVITARQIEAKTTSEKYLTHWNAAIYVVISLGGCCLLFEVWQFCLDWRRYFTTPYNYLDLVSFGLPIIGCVNLLLISQGTHDDVGPDQIWWISFALLAVYLNILFELKVFRPLGTAVHIILNITSKILWFMAVFAIVLVAFTHSFMHITHTKKDPCFDVTDDKAACQASETDYPQDPISALFSTFFFLAGIYDPISNDLSMANDSNISVKVLLALFVFFTVILLMNVLIAIMNDGYGESRDEGKLAWLKQWSEVIVEAELFLMQHSTRDNRDFFPDYIYYGASPQDVEKHMKKKFQSQSLESKSGKEYLPNIATHNVLQRNFRSVHEELNFLVANQQNIQSDVQYMTSYVMQLVEHISQLSNPGLAHNVFAIQSGTNLSHMELFPRNANSSITSLKNMPSTTSSINATHMVPRLIGAQSRDPNPLRSRPPMATANGPETTRLNGYAASTLIPGHPPNLGPLLTSPPLQQSSSPGPALPGGPSSNPEYNTAKGTAIVKESGDAMSTVLKGSSWFRRAISSTGDAACGVGSVVLGTAAVGTAVVAAGAPHKYDGVWKRTVQVLATRKAHVDEVCPISKTSYVYYDEDVYDAVLTEKKTGVTNVTQLLYDTDTKGCYVYHRHGDTDYKLDGPHETIEAAKEAFQVTYKEKFDVEWSQRETTVSEHWSYETKSYETFEEIEEVEEVVEESEASTIAAHQEEVVIDDVVAGKGTTATTAVTTEDEIMVQDVTKVEAIVDDVKETVVIKESGVANPAVSKGSSWFSRVISKSEAAAHGVGSAAVGVGAVALGSGAAVVECGVALATAGALHKVDGVWKRTVQVFTTRKAHVDKVCPIAKTAYVYYDDGDVYDAALTEKKTGTTYVTQLLYDTDTKVYYVYNRHGDTDYMLDGPLKTIEAAKDAFQVTYKEKFDVDWTQRETIVSEHWIYRVKTYETFEEVEEIEEIIDEAEVAATIAREQARIMEDSSVITETTTSTKTTAEEDIPIETVHNVGTVIEYEEPEKAYEGTIDTSAGAAIIGAGVGRNEDVSSEVEEQEETPIIVEDPVATKENIAEQKIVLEHMVEEKVKEDDITTKTGMDAKSTGVPAISPVFRTPAGESGWIPTDEHSTSKSSIFSYNIRRQGSNDDDYTSGIKPAQRRDYERDNNNLLRQNRRRRVVPNATTDYT
ncbi:hypothetical protein BGX27_001808 [Mortierella sp. AM989]|nr:hypothetical protein BGX27_001808 [Mortierella sp. AM989]